MKIEVDTFERPYYQILDYSVVDERNKKFE